MKNLCKQNLAWLLLVLVSLLLESCHKLTDKKAPVPINQIDSELAEEKFSSIFPKEIWQKHILPYIPAEHIGKMRQANRAFYRLTTGYDKPGVVGVDHKPTYNIQVDSWMIDRQIDFKNEKKFKALTPLTIPSPFFYQFLEKAQNLPQPFWPYWKDTHIKEISLFLDGLDIAEVFKYLQGTNIHSLDLSSNYLGASGAQALANALPNLQIHTLNFRNNQIGALGAEALANVLPNLQIHTLHLGSNSIDVSGVKALANALCKSKIHTLQLPFNSMGNFGAQALADALPDSRVHTLDLSGNQIGSLGAEFLSRALPHSRIHTLYFDCNSIGDSIKKLLREKHPNIKWRL